MAISVFDIFKIGIGPSSSHTVGPMKAARQFVLGLQEDGLFEATSRVRAEMFGSLGFTGKGHHTDRAVLLGLEGETPEGVDPEIVLGCLKAAEERGTIRLAGRREVAFDVRGDIVFHRNRRLPLHSNGMLFSAFDGDGELLRESTFYSVGGGFVVEGEGDDAVLKKDDTPIRYPFTSAAELLALCEEHELDIWQVVLENEKAWRTRAEIRQGIARIWETMKACIDRGCRTEGTLPGGLKVARRAPGLYRSLTAHPETALRNPLNVLDWVNLYALAVNEENAAGGRVVTAPTNGAAGIVPAVALYYERFCDSSADGILHYFLTAGAIAMLYIENASISGAEVGCQGEVGVACSMAAGGLTAALGGSNEQVENAAEIGMEHNLGLTCDPVGGLVQIPCIERNAMGSVKAINAARMALRGDGSHMISLDRVITVMRQTGADMQTKYKETSRGGLAVNVIEC